MANKENSSSPLNDEVIPTIDYSMHSFNDLDERSKSLHYLSNVCKDYGFFHLVNHGVPHRVFEGVLKGISDFFDPTEVEDRRLYEEKDPTDRIQWGLSSSVEEVREHIKVVVHPMFHSPPKSPHFSSVTNLFPNPPNFKSEGSMGLADHTDPGLFVSLIQDVNGGLKHLNGKFGKGESFEGSHIRVVAHVISRLWQEDCVDCS
ncbi:hypothetical protein TIFTF001_041442 [Ficus carica]|uniref:Non-haem dioxygenase N-terminal domain-containing protein n=1 Tax=Ficus carica TaxID=3494 RepID=A0AA87ZWK6_FICCA|nr:hypothetical protein TIFTF001_041442 [Ficus carica]